MRYSITFAALTAAVIAAPMEMKNMETANAMHNMNEAKQAADTSYGAYGKYGNYANYGAYPGGVEEAAKAMAKAKRSNMMASEMMNDAAVADMMRKESMMMHEAGVNHMKRKEMMSNKMMMDAKAMEMMDKGAVNHMKRKEMMNHNMMIDAKAACAEDAEMMKRSNMMMKTGGVETEVEKMQMA